MSILIGLNLTPSIGSGWNKKWAIIDTIKDR